MKDLNYYRRINGTYGCKNKRDVNIKKTQNELFKNLSDNPNCQEVKFFNELEYERVIIFTGRNLQNKETKYIIRKPNKRISVGDSIIWNSSSWLCLSKDEDETIYSKGAIMRCNNKLKWQDKELNTHEFDCVLLDKTSVYSSGVLENKFISLTDDQILLIVQSNEFTSKIPYDKKVIFNHDKDSIYKIRRIDKLTEDGLVFIRAEHDMYDPNVDNLELNISNGVVVSETPTTPEVPTDPTDPTPDNFTISITGEDTIASNMSQTYTAVIKNNGVIDTTQTVKWELDNIDAKGVTIESQTSTSCTLHKSSGFGEAYLKATLDVDTTIFIEKMIIAG